MSSVDQSVLLTPAVIAGEHLKPGASYNSHFDSESPANRAYFLTDEVRIRDESLNSPSGVAVFTGVSQARN